MFRLQRLEITGFKSFADYTEIVFTDSGITAVVGPNGCGKSNVSDAFSWVLGEQRAKSLRGEEMKDVIFQGTSKRSAGGMAEVVLHLVRDDAEFDFEETELEDIDEALSELDENAVEIEQVGTQNPELKAAQNGFHTEEVEVEKVQAAQVGSVQTIEIKKQKRHWKPRSIALEFMPGEAVSVTRRLHLSGESEYLLNNKACRLRDIQDLFAGTGLSGAHYAIIEQGRIGQILSAKPSDRRNLIEEAAGISKFRTRQRAAETRLEAAKLNLQRISDIVSEIEKQANSLRRQAAKTQRYKILREELRQILRQVFTAEGKYLSDLFEELEEKLAKAASREREVFAAVGAEEEEFRAATIKAREAEENLSEIRTRHSEHALERDRTSREFRYQEEQIANLKQRSAVLQGEIEATEERLKLVRSELERLTKDERKEREEAGSAELAFREVENKYRAKLQELNEIETRLEAQRGELLQHTTAAERLTEIERQLENTAERLKERAEGLRREGERAEETFAEHRQNAENLEKSLQAERVKLENLQNERSQIRQTVEHAKTILHASESELKKLRDEFSRKRNRLETLLELEEKRAIYAPSIQKLFAEQKKIGVELQGILADKLNVDEKAEKAVENLFGSFLQAVLVKSETDARKLINYLNVNNFGRIAVLVQSPKPKAQNAKSGNKNSIANHIGASDEFAEILADIFPREMAAQFTDDFDNIEEKNDISVTFGGDVNIGGKLFVGGKTNANEKNGSLLAFKRELRQLESDTNKLNKEIEKAEKETEKARQALTEKENKLVDLQSLIVKVERELLAQEIEAKSLAQEIERARRHQRVVAEETGQIETEIAEIRRKQAEAKTNAEKAEKARLAAAEKLEKTTVELNKIRQNLEAENTVLNEKRTLAATSEERRRSAASALRRVEIERTELESRISRLNFETAQNRGKAEELNALLAESKQKIASAEAETLAEQNELDTAKAHLTVAREQADVKSAELAELNKQSAEARNERAALEIRQTETMTRLRSLKESCAQDLNLSLVELIENEEVEEYFDLEDAKKRAQDLRQKLDNFGAINMLALEELSEVEERLLFLTAQRQDILDSIAAAEEALQEIKQRSREKFREAFHAINRNFVEFFQELFGGGRGEMVLLESEDVLEAGIEIVAQPPGKRLQNILLLSGGEKAMTAIALVLGIFKYRPAPFCLLDEVDAPLDDANVGRFVNKIAEMSEKTQFIVITHNKRTMEAARALYGVTMQEAGVSKVVSVKFD